MNILFISKLSAKKGCGPYYSIPNQVLAQKKYDNVFWYNMNDVESEDWKSADVQTLKDHPAATLQALPQPFDHPDIVVIEEQYNFFNTKIVKEIRKLQIPYILVPRCSLTRTAQSMKRCKKAVGNIIYFNKFMRDAAAIQYLTEDEKSSSGEKWNKNGIVIPNGIVVRPTVKKFNSDCIKGTFIGRINIKHKGLDLLLSACADSRAGKAMREADFAIGIFGDGAEEDIAYLTQEIKNKGIEDIVTYYGPIYGEEKFKRLSESDVFLLTSRFEGLPMGILEALSYGVPVAVTRGSNMKDAVTENQAGWGCQTNVEDIAHMLVEITEGKESLCEKSKNCIELAKKYSWDEIALKTHEILGSIVNK